MLKQFLHFAAVGLSGTSVQYGCLAIALALFGKPGVLYGSAIGYILGSVLNYLLNYFFTFRSDKSHLEAAPKYFMVLAVGWCLNLGFMSLFVYHWNWHPWLAQIITTGLGLCWNFTGSRLWAFNAPESDIKE